MDIPGRASSTTSNTEMFWNHLFYTNLLSPASGFSRKIQQLQKKQIIHRASAKVSSFRISEFHSFWIKGEGVSVNCNIICYGSRNPLFWSEQRPCSSKLLQLTEKLQFYALFNRQNTFLTLIYFTSSLFTGSSPVLQNLIKLFSKWPILNIFRLLLSNSVGDFPYFCIDYHCSLWHLH